MTGTTKNMWTRVFGLAVCSLLWLAACGGEEATLSPPTAVSNTTSPPPTVTAPTNEPTLSPPQTAATTATPPPTAVPGEEATILTSPADFGDNRNPLTGEDVDPANLARRPIAVKLSNAPPIYTRPQSGLNDADWVYEHTTEGAITRFTAVIYGKTPPRVGPIRSARLIDLELPAMYDAALAYSGSSAGVGQRLRNADFSSRILNTGEPGYYRTGENKPVEHTLYARPEELWQALANKGLNTAPNFGTALAFTSQPPGGGEPAGAVVVDYHWTVVEWRYDPENGRYWRWADGVPHNDGNTNEQVNAANVVIISPFHVEDPTICEEIRNGVCAHLSVQIQLWGSGSGLVLRDGEAYQVTWRRENRNDLLTFTDANGEPFPLQIGNSWVQVAPSWLSDPVSVTP